MKKIILLVMVISLGLNEYSFGQKCCGIFTSSKNNKKRVINIYFDENGIPTNEVEEYIPFGSQVNLIALNINPINQLPETKTFFKDYYIPPSDIPDISKLLRQAADSPKTIPKKESRTTENYQNNVSQAEFKRNETFNSNEFIDLFNQESLVNSQIILDSIRVSTNPDKTKLLLEDYKRENKKLEDLIKAKKEEIENYERVIADFKKSNEDLLKAITQLKKMEELTPNIRNDYRSFIKILDSINYLLTLQPAVYKLFSQQFIDIYFTQTTIDRLVRVRLPIFKDSLDNAISIQGNFLRSKMDDLEKLYSSLTENIKKANENIASDSFGTNKTTEIELLNREKRKVSVKIGSISIDVNKEPLFKDQLEFTTKQITRFRNDKFRDSLFVFADTVLIQILKLYHNKFQQTIKSFQANADEIKINLPYKNNEPYIIKTRCRFKVEGSTGIFAHFFGADDKYKVVQAAQLGGADSLQVVKQHKENMILSLGFLANVYIYDPTKLFNPGFSVGLNFPINSQQGTGIAQLVAGLSFFSTTADKLSLTFGVSLRRGQVLNSNNLTAIDRTEKYVFNNKNTLEPTYDQVTKVGGFFGLSYSLFGGKKTSKNE